MYQGRTIVEANNKNIISPSYRYQLKARMVLSGYRTNNAFADHLRTDPARVSRILNGWEHPSPKLAQKMALSLGITLKELRELL
jgi:hypothetical protein